MRRTGHGYLTIDNGTASDAVAVLRDVANVAVGRAIYVRSHDSTSILHVRPGTYRLRFQFGSNWTVATHFCPAHGTSEFDTPFAFEELRESAGVNYSHFSVTLHAVLNGDAKTSRLPDEPLFIPTSQ